MLHFLISHFRNCVCVALARVAVPTLRPSCGLQALSAEESVAAHLESALKETADLMRTITDLPNKTRHRVMVSALHQLLSLWPWVSF
jgi:hypothetical protein